MTKEMTPLEAFKNILGGLAEEELYVEDEIDIVETALKRVEELDKSYLVSIPRMTSKKNIIDELVVLQKAIKIIKEKTLTINDLYWLKNGNYKEYRKNLEILYSGVEKEHLQKVLKTKEEYELLKEVLL